MKSNILLEIIESKHFFVEFSYILCRTNILLVKPTPILITFIATILLLGPHLAEKTEP